MPRAARGRCQPKGYWIALVVELYLDTITVQAPQPPPPQEYLVPVRRTQRKGVKEKWGAQTALISTFFPLHTYNKQHVFLSLVPSWPRFLA